MRERGSKHAQGMSGSYGVESLPVRERGSKQLAVIAYVGIHDVAPRAGARIETRSR